MRVLIQKFYDEPVFALGVLQIAAVALAGAGVISAVVGSISAAVIIGVQRYFVRPDKTARRR